MRPQPQPGNDQLVALLLLGGFLLFTKQGAALIGRKPLDPLGSLRPKQPEDPLTAAIKVGGAILSDQLADKDSALRTAGRKLDDTFSEAFGLNKAKKRKKQQKATFNAIKSAGEGAAAQFARKAWTILTRPDVVRWEILPKGGIKVTFQGTEPNSDAKRTASGFTLPGDPDATIPRTSVIEVPANVDAVYSGRDQFSHLRLAFSAEPIVRTIGRYQRSGYRLAGNFTTFAVDGFHPQNPFAPRASRVDVIAAGLGVDPETGAVLGADDEDEGGTP